MNIIETRNLTRRFGRAEAVHELNLAVPAGSVFALLGPNGAGKTTTIKMLVNLLRPTAGEAQVLGVDSRKLGERELAQLGYVSENQQLPVWMTVRQFLDYCRPFYPTWDRELETTLLARFELPASRKLAQLSRGMLMKVALLSSLAYRPRLLILDEPFSGLDPLVRDEFIKGVLEVSAQGDWTVLVSSHDLSELEQVCDWMVLIDTGRSLYQGPTRTLLDGDAHGLVIAPRHERDLEPLHDVLVASGHRPERREHRIVLGAAGFDIAELAANVNRAAFDAGIVLTELTPQRTTLEDRYLSMVQGGAR